MSLLPALLLFCLCLSFLYIVPGWALLSLFGINKVTSLTEKFCLAGGLSISLYAVLFHVFYQFKIAPARKAARKERIITPLVRCLSAVP